MWRLADILLPLIQYSLVGPVSTGYRMAMGWLVATATFNKEPSRDSSLDQVRSFATRMLFGRPVKETTIQEKLISLVNDPNGAIKVDKLKHTVRGGTVNCSFLQRKVSDFDDKVEAAALNAGLTEVSMPVTTKSGETYQTFQIINGNMQFSPKAATEIKFSEHETCQALVGAKIDGMDNEQKFNYMTASAFDLVSFVGRLKNLCDNFRALWKIWRELLWSSISPDVRNSIKKDQNRNLIPFGIGLYSDEQYKACPNSHKIVCTEATQQQTNTMIATTTAVVGVLIGAYVVAPGIVQSILSCAYPYVNNGARAMTIAWFLGGRKISSMRGEFSYGNGRAAKIYHATSMISIAWVASDLFNSATGFFSWIASYLGALLNVGGKATAWLSGTISAGLHDIGHWFSEAKFMGFKLFPEISKGNYPTWESASNQTAEITHSLGGGEISNDASLLDNFKQYTGRQVIQLAVRLAITSMASLLITASNITWLPEGMRKAMIYTSTVLRSLESVIDSWQLFSLYILPLEVIFWSFESDMRDSPELASILLALRVAFGILYWQRSRIKKFITSSSKVGK